MRMSDQIGRQHAQPSLSSLRVSNKVSHLYNSHHMSPVVLLSILLLITVVVSNRFDIPTRGRCFARVQVCRAILLYLIEKLSILLFRQSISLPILTLVKLSCLPRIQISLTVFAAVPPCSPPGNWTSRETNPSCSPLTLTSYKVSLALQARFGRRRCRGVECGGWRFAP
jgi:hypothetical protein